MQIWDFTTERNTYLFTLQITFYGVVRNVASMVENDYGGTCLLGEISLKIVRVFFRILSLLSIILQKSRSKFNVH